MIAKDESFSEIGPSADRLRCIGSPRVRRWGEKLVKNGGLPPFFHSRVGAQALSETLMATVAEQGGRAVLQRLAERQQRLQAAHVYWDKHAHPPAKA